MSNPLHSPEKVFDRDWNSVKWPQFRSSPNGLFGFFCFLTCFLFQQCDKRIQISFTRLNSLDMGVQHFDR